MNASSLTEWFQQVTTGHGFAVAAPILAAYFSGTVSGQATITAPFGAVILAVWPEAKKA